MYQLVITTCTLIGSSVDFDSNPINVTFIPGEVIKSVNISVMCDKIVEGTESFYISLTLTSISHQVRTGRDRAAVKIEDTTSKLWSSNEYRGWYDWINYTAIVNFKQSSYEVMEDKGEEMIMIELSQPSSEPFEVMVTIMDVTAKCEW